jgi:myosin heavy subunit
VFIRKPVTLFNLEERRERCLNDVVSIIQGAYRSWAARKYGGGERRMGRRRKRRRIVMGTVVKKH